MRRRRLRGGHTIYLRRRHGCIEVKHWAFTGGRWLALDQDTLE